ncbi:MAG: 3-isopropylmalate dehydratase large subunit [Anaerolineae bacterium]|nr:3-isopropylmalate dehydratase large subunit [Anaerolineae bacterium]MBL8105975.1 3-isopropylmalate dehydratase large subunit [Anaerolineales bacterium]MCC7189070.1 3-isopropylmalate dehydratase large subunit [Anaerolineales bacterium]
MGTLVEEIFSRKAGRQVQAGEILLLDVDYIMSHDNTTPLAIKAFRDIGKPIFDKNKIVIHFDHAYPAPNILAAENHKKIIEFVKEQELPHLLHQGVCHQVMIEEGYITPGAIVIGADSHSNTYGAMGAFGAGLGSTEIGVAWVTGKCWFKVPETIRVELSGQAQHGVYAKDVMIHIAGLLGMDGGTYRSVEFGGEYIDNLPMHERIVFPNMSTEIGAKCGLIAADEVTINYLESQTPAEGPFEALRPINPRYERILEIDVSTLTPQVACHPDVDNVKPLSEVEGLDVHEVYIGTCTNARYEDLEIVANMLRGKKVNPLVRVIVTPASDRIYKKALKNGLIEILMDAGCTVTGSGCGACIGRHGGILAPGERALTTMNRNFIGRMGSPLSEIYLASPATAAATALTGKITDPRNLLMQIAE